WTSTVEPRERLHCLDARERLVYVHRVQERFIVTSLELVRADQEAVRVLRNLVRDLVRWKTVERGLGNLGAAVLVFSREGDDSLIRTLALFEIVTDGVEILDGALDAAGHHHCPRLPADLVERDHLLEKVVHHDLGFEMD